MQHAAKSLEKSLPGGAEALAILNPSLELQHLWFRLAVSRPVQSLALVPAERDVSTLGIARSLAQVAAALPDSRVLVVNASLRDCLPPRGPGPHPAPSFEDFASSTEDGPFGNCDVIDFSRLPADDAERALLFAPQLIGYLAGLGKRYGTALFAVDSILYQTRAIPLVRSLDRVALCFSLGRTSFEAARHMVDLVGRDRVLGAVAMH